jgi:hypothetical protein
MILYIYIYIYIYICKFLVKWATSLHYEDLKATTDELADAVDSFKVPLNLLLEFEVVVVYILLWNTVLC